MKEQMTGDKGIKITPQTYIDMNKEFEEDGTMVRIEVPTQEAIDKWLNHKEDIHSRTVEPVDMVAQMWEQHRKKEKERDQVQALIYSNGSQECERAESLLNSIDQNVKVFLLGTDFTDPQFRAEFGDEAEYPQISVGLDHRGSLKETLKYMSVTGMFL
jgi:hypothetical protein